MCVCVEFAGTVSRSVVYCCVCLLRQDPLNSDDDISNDDDPSDVFDTENVVVCQFDKVCEYNVIVL